MKFFKLFLIVFLPLFFALTGCKLEEPSATSTQSDLGTHTVASYVALGNSLTAGVQSGSLVEDHQVFSFPNLIAGQLGVETFAQPTVSWPGISPILQLNPATSSVSAFPGAAGTPTNLAYGAPYNNLGIPTATTWDVLNATNSTNNYRYIFFGEDNEAVDLVLRNPNLGNTSMFAQAAMLHPDMITLWIGSNDVLGFATSGGLKPITPYTDFTNPFTGLPMQGFESAMTELMDTVATLGAMVAVANVPDVTSPPFFTTVGPGLAASFIAGGIPYPLSYEKGTDDLSTGIATGSATTSDLLNGNVLILLTGSGYTGEIGKPSGKWYRDFAAMKGVTVDQLLATVPLVDTTQAFGFHPQNPWPSALILDADEIAMAQAATNAYNQLIAAKAAEKGFALFDANGFMSSIVANGGVTTQGYSFNATFVYGGMFSLDGVHLSNAGYAVVANKFIEAINAKYDVSIAPVLIRNVLGFAPVKKMNATDMKYDLRSLSGLLEMTGGKIW